MSPEASAWLAPVHSRVTIALLAGFPVQQGGLVPTASRVGGAVSDRHSERRGL